MKQSKSERIGLISIYSILIFTGIITIYPFIYCLSMSFSDPQAAIQGAVWLWPVGFSITSYQMVFSAPHLWTSYFNTIWYAVVGTSINLTLTILGAYPLSHAKMVFRKFITIFITITMFISGGLVPLFILVIKLGIYDTRWAIVLPSAVSAFNIFLMYIYFQNSVPNELIESATIDGCSEPGILLKIMLPLSKPIIAVITLFVAVGYWNNYFSAIVFLPSQALQPITVLLQRVLIANSSANLVNMIYNTKSSVSAALYAEQVKYAIIIITILPIVCIYPFFQKHFVKGIMLGAVKG